MGEVAKAARGCLLSTAAAERSSPDRGRVAGWFCLGTAGKELVTECSYVGAQQEAFRDASVGPGAFVIFCL